VKIFHSFNAVEDSDMGTGNYSLIKGGNLTIFYCLD